MSVSSGIDLLQWKHQHFACASSGVSVRLALCDPGAFVLPLCRSASCAWFSDGAVPRWLCGQKP